METLIAIATVAAIACLGILSPGPDFVAVTYTAVTGSRRSAAAVAAGVVLGNGIWAGAALLGVMASLWFSVVVLALSTPKASAAFRRFKVYFESLFGLLLVTSGLRQLLARVN